MSHSLNNPRRRLLGAGLAVFGLTSITIATTVQAVTLTPRQSRGPFYPTALPLDKDNDLIYVAGRNGIAKGEIANVVGRVVDDRGRPVDRARVEIWQCDAHGRYHHSRDRRNVPLDENFQGYGQSFSDAEGGYRFRTIKPVAYPGRAPHIHFAISGPDFEPLVTQMYVAGAPENARDFLLNSVSDPTARQQLLVPFTETNAAGELVGRFDIVLAADGRFSG
ncbi:MAG: protocatechuate 3,4-dioxygenase [Candidatus Competibacteraceae bacterium]|nr:protocatechuate 3,4-dioxygenase [Candidatus Competibacteraceae bacterium]